MKKLFLPAMMLAVAFASCSNDDEVTTPDAKVAMGVNVTVKSMSRAMVMGESLKNGDKIAVSVVQNADDMPYDGHDTGYMNVGYMATGEVPNQSWGPADASKQILLSGTAAKAIAYYPFIQDATFTYNAIPVDITEQHDWMYSTAVGPKNDADPEVSFTMEHAQTAVNIKVVRDASYTGDGLVEDLAVTSTGFATEGEFNAETGAWDATKTAGANTAIIIAEDFTLTKDDESTIDVKESEKANPYMVIPVDGVTDGFTISATIDGNPYTVPATMPAAFAGYEKGKIYSVSVKITNVGLTIDSVVILTEWTEEDLSAEDDGQLKPANP